MKVNISVDQLCLTLCDHMDCNLPGSSVHGILQARILEWVAISYFRGSSWPRDQTQISYTAGRFFTIWATSSVLFSSVAQSCPTPCNPMNRRMPGLPVHHQLPEFTLESVMSSSHFILCHPLLLLPPIPPSIRVFSNESILCMRWPKYWSFSFSIIPSKEIPGLISFRMDWLDLLAVRKS